MFTRSLCVLAVALPACAAAGTCYGGQAIIVPVSELVREASLVAVVEVTNVTHVDVPRGDNPMTRVFVAQAIVRQSLKPDGATYVDREIVIVGSTVPRSSAVWRPIEKKKYLAFLHPEQGHFRYGIKYGFREVNDKGLVTWYDYEQGQADPIKFVDIKLEEAVRRVKAAIAPTGAD